jgi:hypothetical protein
MRRRRRNPTYRLRRAVDALPRHTREAMLRGIASNRVIVGAYVDPGSGGICPMLAAHRNGGRTSVASFAREWDAYTGAKRPRPATRHEVRTLRAILSESLSLDTSIERTPIAELAAQIRAEREQLARCAPADAPVADRESSPAEPVAPDAEPARRKPAKRDIRIRRRDPYLDLLAVAEAALAEEGTWARADEHRPAER